LKKRGVIAAVCAVRAMAKKLGKVTADRSNNAGGSGDHTNNEIEKTVKKLIDSSIRETRETFGQIV
jgi:hypothetical protein